MKTHHYIFITTAVFVILFYNEDLGLNLGILAVVYSILTYFKTVRKNRTPLFFFLLAAGIFSGAAFAWYGDFSSFLALATSVLMLGYRSQQPRMKTLMLIPVFVTNIFTFICRVFSFERWLPNGNISDMWQKILAFVLIPMVLLTVFFAVYSAGSDHFAGIFENYELDINLWQLFVLTCLGFFIAFNYWNYAVEKHIYKQNHILDNDFKNRSEIQKPTWSFFDLNFERMSGVISLFCLNILLAVFIFTFNYEQFIEIKKTTVELGEETHERVNAVILSIVMAILVIMFYFKGGFNFDKKAGGLKILAKIWIFLNAVLIISAVVKNAEYIADMGFTYKKLGVYAFLILSLMGLICTFIKIHKKKTNAFLFNTMTWFFYGTVLVCSFVNWGSIITSENVKRTDFAFNYHLEAVSFNEKILMKYADEKRNLVLKKQVLKKINSQKSDRFLSKVLFYDSVPE